MDSDLGQRVDPEISDENFAEISQPTMDDPLALNQNHSPATEDEPPPSPHIMKTKRKSRRVHFPDGDKIVSERIPPPNPWKNVGDVSTEELVAAYHASCAFNQVKPSTVIIQQLEKMRDLSVRVDSFNFKGEKIDSRTAESLEEVFRRVQFNLLDIEGCSLEDEAAVALFEMVEFYETAVKMSMSSVKGISFRGWQAVSKLMRKSACLETLDISRTSWSEHSVPILCRAVRADTCLVALHLEACNLAGRPLVLLMAALRMNHGIRELFLADNRLMPSDAFHIGGMLKHNAGIKLLDLRNNNMQDVGANHISDGLAGQMRGQLNTLVLWNNHITHVGAGHLGKTLPMITSLETLNIGQNNFGIEGIMKLKEGLMKNKFLQRMGLFSCRINDEGAIALAEYLADNCQLIRLDLRENDIRTGGLMALSRSLKLNKVLLRLDLDKSIKKESLNGHAELQQQFLADIEQLLLANRQYLEANHIQAKTVTDEQPSPQKIPSQGGDPGGTSRNEFAKPPSDDPQTSSSNNEININDDPVATRTDDGDVEESLKLVLSKDPSSELSESESIKRATHDDGRLLRDNSILANNNENGATIVSSVTEVGGDGLGTTTMILDSDTLTVSTDNRLNTVDTTPVSDNTGASSSTALYPQTTTGQGDSSNLYDGETEHPHSETETQSTFISHPLHSDIDERTEIRTIPFQGKSVRDSIRIDEMYAMNGEDAAASVNGEMDSGALHSASPPGIRINENIKLLAVTNHMLDAEQGLDQEGQELMASAIDEGLPGNSDNDKAIPNDGSKEHLPVNQKNIPSTSSLVPVIQDPLS